MKRSLLDRLGAWADVLKEHDGGIYAEAAARIRELEAEVSLLHAAPAPAPVVVAPAIEVELKTVERAGGFLGWWREMQGERK